MNWWIYALLVPPFALLTVFTLIPIAQSFVLSLQHWTLKSVSWVGLQNYQRLLLEDPVFYIALRNTFVYTATVVPISLLVSLILAELIRTLRPSVQTFFKGAYYLPGVVSGVVLVMIWRWIYLPERTGLLNFLLSLVGQEPVLWLAYENTALASVIGMTIAGGNGAAIVMLLAAAGGIPAELYESARLDGSNRFSEWWHISLPLLRPSILYLAVMGTIGSFQIFTSTLLLTKGGPNYGTTTVVLWLWKQGFDYFDFGYASTIAVALFLVILVFSALLFRLLASEVEF
ncbi:MAG: carbohydrate ABC transporter permease [Anaerolineae bacterium]